MRDLCDLHRDVRSGNVDDTCTAFLYNQLREFYATFQIEHWLYYPTLPAADILWVYGYRFHHRHWSKLPEFRAGSVSAVWRAIATVHLLDG